VCVGVCIYAGKPHLMLPEILECGLKLNPAGPQPGQFWDRKQGFKRATPESAPTHHLCVCYTNFMCWPQLAKDRWLEENMFGCFPSSCCHDDVSGKAKSCERQNELLHFD